MMLASFSIQPPYIRRYEMNSHTKSVHVRAYHRVVSGHRQHVCAHNRSLPR